MERAKKMSTTLRATAGRTEIAVNATERKAAEAAVVMLRPIEMPKVPERVTIQIPSEILGLMTRVLDAVARGERITLGTIPDELSTAVAADQLGVSRPTLMKLISAGAIPSHKVGSHTRLRTEDVVAFRRSRLERQRKAFDEMRALDEELGL